VVYLAPFALGLVLGVLTGGSVDNLLQRMDKIRWSWVIVVTALISGAARFSPLGTLEWFRFAYLVALATALAWTFFQLSALPGIWLVSIGLLANLVVMIANGGHMPVSPISGLVPRHPGGIYVVADSTTKLNWLADWIRVPFAGAASLGDFFIGLGIGVVTFAITRFSGSATKLNDPQPIQGRRE
jgi:hypothetical protein